MQGVEGRNVAERLLNLYYTTVGYPWTRHHIDSFDQFLSTDLPSIVKAANPILVLEDQIGSTGQYAYKAEIYIGGLGGDRLTIGTPTLQLNEDVRLLLPNEARLRNLTYGSMVETDIHIRITYTRQKAASEGGGFQRTVVEMSPDDDQYKYLRSYPLFKMPIMLHSRYCLLNGKPEAWLKEAGECIYDYGGYFIVDGSEKVLITRQEQAFNTLYIQNQDREPQIATYATISCLSPQTQQVKRVAFGLLRREKTLQVTIPFVRKPVPVFILFRALGIQSDYDIMKLIFPDFESAEAKLLMPMLEESIVDAFPFLDTFSAVQYLKVLTKGFSEAHVLDIIHNQLFIHVEDLPQARAFFLAECVRKILRVAAGIDAKTDRDDTRNQRCLTSGFLTRMLFQGIYSSWVKAAAKIIDTEYKYNTSVYAGENFANLFSNGILFVNTQRPKLSVPPERFITAGLMRGFKGKWGSRVGEEKVGAIQPLSRLSYMDFLSHCRRVVLEFDTTMKLTGPRRLHTSQFGYFCTHETPGGSSIGITKNLSNLATISISTNPRSLISWLLTRGGVIPCEQMTATLALRAIPLFINGGIMGFTLRPILLRDVLKLFKWTGCLPPSASISFSIREKKFFIYVDEGRPVRPLIHLDSQGALPLEKLKSADTWRHLVMGKYPKTEGRSLSVSEFVDPLETLTAVTLEQYREELGRYAGVIEYVDPYEANEAYVACFPEQIQKETSHLEIHPSSIFGLMTSVIPFANHNQAPRNQLSCSQSKQGLSVYATNYPNRFDNQVHVLSYGEAPLVRTLYYDYIANGQMGYGQNIILAMGCFSGYNQEDGIVMNLDSIQRGMFHSVSYRSYETFEEDDKLSHTSTRIANPAKTPFWLNLRPGLDYSGLDERGLIREGSYVDENTVLVGKYIKTPDGVVRDASLTPQVWTTGRVEKVTVVVNNAGLSLVKIRILQYRIPELGDKFSNRHGQKGTIGMLIRGVDMPRTAEGLVPDMIMNSHAIPSRMTIAQLLETLLGKCAAQVAAVGNATTFMNEGSPVESIGKVLQDQYGMHAMGEELLYDGTTGTLIPSTIFMGSCYTMRLKHMTEDKWNARGQGRKEQRTHQPTGGRGNQGGLRMGEMERDAVIGHGIASFINESYMKRADGTEFIYCNGCGTIPIYNEKQNIYVCSLCDGPVRFIGDNASNLELLPSLKKSQVTFSKVAMPYAFKLLEQELGTYMNIGMRVLTNHDLQKMSVPHLEELTEEEQAQALLEELPERVLPDTQVPEYVKEDEEQMATAEDLDNMSALPPPLPVEQPVEQPQQQLQPIDELVEEEPPMAEGPPMVLPTGPYMVIPMTPQAPVQMQPQAQPQVQPQVQQMQQMQQPASVVRTGIPGAPPMISVDTSEAALRPLQTQPLRTAIQNKTRRVRFGEPQEQQQQKPLPSNANVRLNVIKGN
jgi:DNA-directed RNA polymerase II subunit RPB2